MKNFEKKSARHFLVWFVALVIFAFLEWRHTGFVSHVFPFPLLIIMPAVFFLGEEVTQCWQKK